MSTLLGEVHGIYQSNYMTLNKHSFCIEDLHDLKQRIIDSQIAILPSDRVISMAFIMRKSFRSAQLKSTIVENILNRSLICFGCEKDLDKIQVKVSDLEMLTNSILSMERNWLTIKQTSTELHCDNNLISTMMGTGLILGEKVNGIHQINKDSVVKFKQSYIALQQLSSSFTLGVKALITLCSQHGLAVLSVQRKFNGYQTFIERADIDLLAGHVKEYYLNHKKLAYRCRLETINLGWVI